MPLNIRNEKVNTLASKLAALTGKNKTEAVEMALENELERRSKAVPLRERVRPIQERIASWPSTGLEADEAFYDDLYGEL